MSNITLPKEFQFLLKEKELPKIVQAFIKIFGTREVPGTKSNPTILGWAKELGLEKVYTNDGIAWCGLLIAKCAQDADKPIPSSPLWALSWREWGVAVQADDARCGDLYVTERRNSKGKLVGGHVGIVIAQNKTHYYVGGGNQGDIANIAMFPKSRKHWIRRPVYVNMPAGAKKFIISVSSQTADKLV